MLPIKDLNPTRRTPFVTYTLIAISVVVFLWEQLFSASDLQNIFLRLSVVPASVVQDPFALETILDFVRSMFLHGGWAHLLGNMLYLWLFGDNIEDRFGAIIYVGIYFIGGFAAAIAQILIDPNSTIPLIGASGAIAAVLGSYLILFPGVRVRGIIFLGFFTRLTDWPAWAVLGLWFGLQLLNGAASLGVAVGASGGVAFFAHIGGFITGVVLTWFLMRIFPQPPRDARREMLYQRAQRYRY